MLYSGQNSLVFRSAPSSETQGQLVGAGKSLNVREKNSGSVIGHKKTKVLWHQSEARTTPAVWNWSVKTLSPGALLVVLDFSSPEFFSRPIRLFPAPTNCPWVSEDDFRVNSLFHHLCSQRYAAQYSYVPLLSLRRNSPPTSSLSFSVRPRSSVIHTYIIYLVKQVLQQNWQD